MEAMPASVPGAGTEDLERTIDQLSQEAFRLAKATAANQADGQTRKGRAREIDRQLDELVARIASGNVDVVFNHGSPGVYERLIRRAKAARSRARFYGVNSGSTQLVRHLGEPGGGHDRTVERGVRPDGRFDEVGGSTLGSRRHGLGIRLRELVEPVQQDTDQRFLVRKVIQQPALGHARGAGGGIHRRGAFTLVDEDAREGIEDGVAGEWGAAHGFSIVLVEVRRILLLYRLDG